MFFCYQINAALVSMTDLFKNIKIKIIPTPDILTVVYTGWGGKKKSAVSEKILQHSKWIL